MKTYSYQAILSSDEDTSYDIELPSLSVRFTNDGAPQRLRRQSSMQKRFIWARQLIKVSVKESLSNDIATPPVTTAQLPGAPRSSRTLLYVPSETVPPNASHLWLSVRFVSPVNENHLRKRLSMRELNA